MNPLLFARRVHRACACVVQRRLYWLLDPGSSLVLVHYLQLPDDTVHQRPPLLLALPLAAPAPKLQPVKAAHGLVAIAASAPDVAICGHEFMLMMVLATPIRTDEQSEGPLLCVFGKSKVILSQHALRCAQAHIFASNLRIVRFCTAALLHEWMRTVRRFYPPRVAYSVSTCIRSRSKLKITTSVGATS